MHRSLLAFALLVVAALSGVALATPASAAPGDITLASTSDTAIQGNGYSSWPSVSADGTKVAFLSAASNLDPGDTDTIVDVYVKDLVTGSLTLASTSDIGKKGNSSSSEPSLSADGTKVAFWSAATNLDPGDTDSKVDVYVKDLVSGKLTLASTSAKETKGTKGNGYSFDPSLSADGTKVAFRSSASNLDPGDTDIWLDVYVKDLVTGSLTLASTSADGTKANDFSYQPSLSADGTKVAFWSVATNFDPRDTDAFEDVYVKDLVTGSLTLASTSADGTKGDSSSAQPRLSADGTRVAFSSDASNFDPRDTDTVNDVYVKDLVTGNLKLASTSADGTKGDKYSYQPSLSADGTRIAFISAASNFDPRDTDTDTVTDVYVKDLVTGNLKLASTSANGTKGNSNGAQASLSADGTGVAFSTYASNLDPGDTDFDDDVYVKELGDEDTPDVPAPNISIGHVTVAEAAGTATLQVTLSRADHQGVSVGYSTSNGAATAGQDYTASAGTLVISAGHATGTITVPILNDTIDEPATQSFSVQLAAPEGAVIVDGSGTVTIRDDDRPTGVRISDAVIVEGDTGTRPMVFTVTLTAPSEKTVKVTFTTASGSASSLATTRRAPGRCDSCPA